MKAFHQFVALLLGICSLVAAAVISGHFAVDRHDPYPALAAGLILAAVYNLAVFLRLDGR